MTKNKRAIVSKRAKNMSSARRSALADEDIQRLLFESDECASISDDESCCLSDYSESDESSTDSEKSVENDVNPGSISSTSASARQWNWEKRDNQPAQFTFVETPGVSARVQRSLGEKTSALSTFSVFASHDFWASVSAETNRYAEQEMGDEDRPKKCYEEQWFDTTPDEIKAYFALCIIMTQVKKHTVKMNWSKRSIVETPIFGKTMSYVRFLLISRFLSYCEELLKKRRRPEVLV